MQFGLVCQFLGGGGGRRMSLRFARERKRGCERGKKSKSFTQGFAVSHPEASPNPIYQRIYSSKIKGNFVRGYPHFTGLSSLQNLLQLLHKLLGVPGKLSPAFFSGLFLRAYTSGDFLPYAPTYTQLKSPAAKVYARVRSFSPAS